MKKAMIASATVIALVVSAGMSTAGPLRDHGQRGNAHDARPAVSQTHNHADRMAKTHRTGKMTDRGFDFSSKLEPGQTNLSSTQQQGLYGSNWRTELVNVDAFSISDGSDYTWVIGKTSGDELSDQAIFIHPHY